MKGASRRAPLGGVRDAPDRPPAAPWGEVLTLVERLRLGVGADDPLGPELGKDRRQVVGAGHGAGLVGGDRALVAQLELGRVALQGAGAVGIAEALDLR